MRWFSIAVAILFLSPIAMAEGDLTQYSYSEYDSQKDSPILVEWFHGEGDEEYVSSLEKMYSAGEITLIHWRTGANEEGGGWPDDDANSRAMFHGIENFPAMAVDGYVVSIEEIDNINTKVRDNEISIDYSIELVGSSEVELISIIEYKILVDVKPFFHRFKECVWGNTSFFSALYFIWAPHN